MTLTEALAYVAADVQERERRARLYRYYRCENDILSLPKKGDGKPDNRLAHGYVSYIANAYAGYMFGEPVSYAIMGGREEKAAEDEALLDAMTDCYRYNDEQAENAALGLDCAICGTAVELLYVDADAVVRFARVDPVGCVGVTDGTLEDNLTALIRYYDRYDVLTKKTVRTLEVYDAEAVTVWKSEDGALGSFGEPEIRPHLFGDVPAVVYRNNLFSRGDAESVLSQIDAYDKMQSDGVNDQDYFTDAYLALVGIGELDEGQSQSMKRDRILLLPDGSDARWLIKQQSDATPQNIKERLNNDIHRFSACPDMSDEKFAGNSSGVALKYKLLQFENVAGIKEREFKRGLQRRLELLCGLWQLKGLPAFDWRAVKIEFHRALPENLLELSQMVGNLSDVLSDETKRSLLPLDIDEAEEKRRLEEERGDSMFTPMERRTGFVEEKSEEWRVKSEDAEQIPDGI